MIIRAGRFPKGRARSVRGFTLLEAMLASAIVGIGIVSTMRLFATCSIQNRAASQMSVAMNLATNAQEAMGPLTFADPTDWTSSYGLEGGETQANFESLDDVDDFDGLTFSPPIDSFGNPIDELSQYEQVVSVWPVYPSKLNVNNSSTSPDVTKGTYTGALRVTVRVLYAADPSATKAEVYRTSWVRLDR
jgi:prepilin-type N-terminal cleavage/methylation domain-containing protein